MYRITSKHNGFIRCGVRHPSEAKEYSDDHFSHDEIMTLEAEPMLVVQHVDGESDEPSDSGDDDITEEEKISAVVDEARKMSLAVANENGKEETPDLYFTEEMFRTLPMPKAQEISKSMYQVTGRSWDGLWKDFSAAQTAAFAKGQE